MFRTLRSRLLLTYILVSGLVLLLVSAGMVLALARGPLGGQLLNIRLYELGFVINSESGARLEDLDPERLQPLAEALGDRHGVRVLVISGREVLADSYGGIAPDVVLPADFSSERPSEGVFRGAQGGSWRFVSQPVGNGRSLLLAARTPILRVITFLGNEIMQPVTRIGVLALALSTLLAVVVSSSVVRPLKKMNKAMQRIAGGKYDERIPVEGTLEMQTAANAFNNMAERVEASKEMERDFVANVSHELKTPLTSIQGYAQAILDGTAADERSRAHASGVIVEEARRLHRLVLDLLDLARMDSGRLQFERSPIKPVILLQNILEKFRVQALEKGVTLESDLEPLPVIVGDGDRLAQVFTNLVDNAIKHTPEGRSIRVTAITDRGRIKVHVHDQGEGIPVEDLPRIFDRFYQVDKSRRRQKGKGSGLGLAISREIVEAHNGSISVESSPGEGSRFTVDLPVIQPWDKTVVQRKPGSRS